MWTLARRPRWIAALILCLAIAAGFAALGQWQLSRSVDAGAPVSSSSEKFVPLDSVAEPQSTLTSKAAGRLVTVDGTLIAGDYELLSGRLNAGVAGFWVVGHLVEGAADSATPGPSLAVALGWAPTTKAAASAISDLEESSPDSFGGRYLPTESPQEDKFEQGVHNSLATAALINQWATAPTSVYSGYLVTDAASPGLEQIDAPAPSTDVSLNWLNIFYAVEWAVFAVFAVFLWFRLVKDAWERELDEIAERELENSLGREPGVNAHVN